MRELLQQAIDATQSTINVLEEIANQEYEITIPERLSVIGPHSCGKSISRKFKRMG